MAKVSVPRDWIAEGTVPAVCIVCGKRAVHRRFPGVSAPSLAWVLVSPLLGLLAFWGYILVSSLAGGRSQAGLPFCDRHRTYWPRRAWLILGGLMILAVLMVVAGLLAEPAGAGKQPAKGHWLSGVAGCWMILFLPAFLVIHLTSMRPIRSTSRTVTFTGVSPGFADEVEDELEEDWD